MIVSAYKYATEEPMNFFMIDATVGAGIKRIRKNFKQFIKV
jgi:hypothetical protein